MSEQAPSVQRELISNVSPPAGTKNVSAASLHVLLVQIELDPHSALVLRILFWPVDSTLTESLHALR